MKLRPGGEPRSSGVSPPRSSWSPRVPCCCSRSRSRSAGDEDAEADAGRASRAPQEGIEAVFQDLALAELQPVYMNLFLGRELVRGPLRRLDRDAMAAETQRLLDDLEVRIDSPRKTLRDLSGGQRQAVAIARAVQWARRLVLMAPCHTVAAAAMDWPCGGRLDVGVRRKSPLAPSLGHTRRWSAACSPGGTDPTGRPSTRTAPPGASASWSGRGYRRRYRRGRAALAPQR